MCVRECRVKILMVVPIYAVTRTNDVMTPSRHLSGSVSFPDLPLCSLCDSCYPSSSSMHRESANAHEPGTGDGVSTENGCTM